VGIVAGRPIDERYADAPALQLLQDDHLVHVVARQPVRRGDEDQVERRSGRLVPQRVKAGPDEFSAAKPVVAEDVCLVDLPPVAGGHVAAQLRDLLLDRLRLLLPLRRHPDVERYSHRRFPPVAPLTPSAGGVGTPDPSDLAHPVARPCSDGFARCVASPPPVPGSLQEGVPAMPCRRWSDRRHHVSRSRPYRLTQNLSLATVPLSTPTASASRPSTGPRPASATPSRPIAGPGWSCWRTPSSAWPASPSRTGISPGSAPSVRPVARSHPPACVRRFRSCWLPSTRPPTRQNPAAGRRAARSGVGPTPLHATRPSRRPPDFRTGSRPVTTPAESFQRAGAAAG